MAGQTQWAHSTMMCGARGTGKSTMMKKIVMATPLPNVLILLEPINITEKTFEPIPLCTPLSKYKGGKALIDASTIDIYRFMDQVERNFRNGIIVIDEAGLYDLMVKNINTGQLEPIKPLKFILKNQRKLNITLYFLYHGISEIPVRLIKWMNNFVLFHQTDEFKHKGAVIPRIEELKAMQLRIRKEYFEKNNIYYAERLQLC